MEPTPPRKEDRNTLMIRFILVYFISILLTVVALYYLFNIPEKSVSALSSSRFSSKEQKKSLDSYMDIVNTLDSCQYYKKEHYLSKLFGYAKENIPEENLYKPLFMKIPDLYDKVVKTSEYASYKEKYEALKEEFDRLDSEKNQLEKELQGCQKELLQVMLKKGSL